MNAPSPFVVDIFRGVPTPQIVDSLGNMYNAMYMERTNLDKLKRKKERLEKNKSESGLSADDMKKLKRVNDKIDSTEFGMESSKRTINDLKGALKRRNVNFK